MEGPACFEPPTGCDRSGLTLPVASYTHADGSCAVIGGYVYRGTRFPALRGAYVYGDECTGKVWVLDASNPTGSAPRQELDTDLSISSFGEDDAAELYLTSLGSGQLFQVTARPA
jgi:hypothetical protein